MLTLRDATERLLAGSALGADESEALFITVFAGGADPVALGGFLVALRAKGETAPEVIGAARAMRGAARRPGGDFSAAIDTCGTGGDGRGGFNLSTAAALIACAAGAKIAKHGNRAVSSRAGSADLLEALGVKIRLEGDGATRLYERTGFTFFFAPDFHPATAAAAPVRRALGLRTVFNLLGPLTNPARVTRQLTGVWDPALLPLYGEALPALGVRSGLIVHGDGHDEIVAHAGTDALQFADGSALRFTITPGDGGLPDGDAAALAGGDAAENAARLRAIFAGGDDTVIPALLLNAGWALVVAGVANGICDAVPLARRAVASGDAGRKLNDIIRESSGGAS